MKRLLLRRWPCDRREAYAPHERCCGVRCHPDTTIGQYDVPSLWVTDKGVLVWHGITREEAVKPHFLRLNDEVLTIDGTRFSEPRMAIDYVSNMASYDAYIQPAMVPLAVGDPFVDGVMRGT